jgi:hypothetical protein
VSEWQPIETAPTDGTNVLAWLPGCGMEIGLFGSLFGPDEKGGAYWFSTKGDGFLYHGEPVYPTHWMPLPPPPNTQEPKP